MSRRAFRAVNLLAPLNSPRTRFSLHAELMPRPILGHWTALGVTNSNVLEDNFEGGAAVWVLFTGKKLSIGAAPRLRAETSQLLK